MLGLILAAVVVAGLVLYQRRQNLAKTDLNAKLNPMWERMANRNRCKWKAGKAGSGALREFTCQTCGVTAYSTAANGPQDCKRSLA